MNDLIRVCEIALRSLTLEEVRLWEDIKNQACDWMDNKTAVNTLMNTRDIEVRVYGIKQLREEVEKIRHKAYAEELKEGN